MNSQNLLIVVSGVALAITIIGWRKVLVWVLSGLVTLAILGLVQVVMLVTATV
ncbi:hypothetical protein [Amycolatopsis taiwanensis]|uniref:Uncharacterized protein n=1 Tax=Amycolatopsis taiwanensis TaxID=342230 RepID=A0A9W6VE02_9PSEU|nr:hypothetical protein [Amycolatopsis taiwanensis]GLY63982.1 hypothetical protein Atai01_06010 [Amycolatopsis taiwanensis]